MINQRRKRMKTTGRLLMITTVIFLSFTLYSGALEKEAEKPETPILAMEKITDFFSGDNFEFFQNTKERVEELSDSIGRGTERIGESIEKLTDFIGFGNTDSDEEESENEEETGNEETGNEEATENQEELENEQETNTTGQIVGTVKSNNGEALENIRMNAGNYATYTNDSGEFVFNNLPYGVYSLSYQESQDQALNPVEEILIDSNNDRYVVSLVLDTGSTGEVLSEDESAREIAVDESTEGAPEDGEMEDQDEDRSIVGFIIFLILVLLAIILFFIINRKHIKAIDGKTGETLGKKKIDVKPVTWIDLTEEFEAASGEKIRVRFIRSAIRKLYGKKVVFTMDDSIIAEIPEYTGELDFLVEIRPLDVGTQGDQKPNR